MAFAFHWLLLVIGFAVQRSIEREDSAASRASKSRETTGLTALAK